MSGSLGEHRPQSPRASVMVALKDGYTTSEADPCRRTCSWAGWLGLCEHSALCFGIFPFTASVICSSHSWPGCPSPASFCRGWRTAPAFCRFGRQSNASEEPCPTWPYQPMRSHAALGPVGTSWKEILLEAAQKSSGQPSLCVAETRPTPPALSPWLAMFVSSTLTTCVAHLFEAIE